MTTYHDLTVAIASVAGSCCSVSIDGGPDTVFIILSMPWWFYPIWLIRRNLTNAVIRSLMPDAMTYELETKIKRW